MGPHRTASLIMVALLWSGEAIAQEPGWHYSHLPGEGDRASMGCTRGSTAGDFTCLVVRCEDDFSAGIHIHASRPGGSAGRWEMTLDRETRQIEARNEGGPYAARLVDGDGWLLDGLRHGSFVYLRHSDDVEGAFAFLDLGGSYRSIAEALYWCAPRLPGDEQIGAPDVEPETENGEM